QKTAQNRSLYQEIFGEEQAFFGGKTLDGFSQIRRYGEIGIKLGAQQLGIEQLLAVLPVIERLPLIDPFVALQSHQRKIQGGGESLGQAGLANSGRTLDQDRLLHPDGQKNRGGDGVAGDVAACIEKILNPLFG